MSAIDFVSHASTSARRYRGWVEPRTTVENWIGRIGLPLYFLSLVAGGSWLNARTSAWIASLAGRDFFSVGGILEWGTLSIGASFLDVARFAPLGLLAVLALPRRRRPSKRLLFMISPAVVIGALLAAIVQYFESGTGRLPGVFALLSAFLLCALGVWVGMNWLRGWIARILIVPKLIAVALLLTAAAGSLVYLTLEPQPFTVDSPTVTAGAARRQFQIFEGKNPRMLEAGATATVRVPEGDLNDLLASAASAGHDAPRTHVDLSGATPTINISAIAPFDLSEARYLNVIAGGVVRIVEGEVQLDLNRFSVGPVEVPAFLMKTLSSRVAAAINHDRRLRPFLAPVQTLRVNTYGLSATYGRADLPPGTIASLFEGAEPHR